MAILRLLMYVIVLIGLVKEFLWGLEKPIHLSHRRAKFSRYYPQLRADQIKDLA